jgi:IS1 family transposase
LRDEFGDAWIWVAFDPRNKLVVSFVVGKRRQNEANKLLNSVRARSDGHIPLFTSDDLDQYETAILNAYGVKEEIPKTGRRGRPKSPKLVPPEGLMYCKVIKQREKGRVTRVDTEVVFGDERKIEELLEASPVSRRINTTFVERNNLTMRERNRRLTRKTMGFSKEKVPLVESLNLYSAIYHFVKPNGGLKLRLDVIEDNRRWVYRTPMMAAGITDHIWTVEELLTFRVFNK